MNMIADLGAPSPLLNDAGVVDELVGLIDRLRLRGYGQIICGIDQALEGAVDGFKNLLAHHLVHEEEILIPALKKAAPTFAAVFDGLKQEHSYLRGEADLLADFIRSGNDGAALARGQFFLTTLYDHIQREAEAVRQSADQMHWKTALRLKSLLESEDREGG
jgi:hypothetical protein